MQCNTYRASAEKHHGNAAWQALSHTPRGRRAGKTAYEQRLQEALGALCERCAQVREQHGMVIFREAMLWAAARYGVDPEELRRQLDEWAERRRLYSGRA